MRLLTYISTLFLLLSPAGLLGQDVIIDRVCPGSVFQYRVEGEDGSTYVWQLTHPDGTLEVLPSSEDNIFIEWDYAPGVYRLTVFQFNDEYECDAIPQEGDVIIFEAVPPPIAFDVDACFDGEQHVAMASVDEGYSIVWYASENGEEMAEAPIGLQPGVYTTWVAAVNDETGCESLERIPVTLTIYAPPLVQCPGTIQTNTHAGLMTLDFITPTGGTYTGLAVSDGFFDPMEAGAGLHEITYTYTDANGCTASCTFTVEVAQATLSLLLHKTAQPEEFTQPGDEILYTLVVENSGDAPLALIRISDPLVGLEEEVTDLGPGETMVFEGVYTITQDDMERGFVTNLALAVGEDDGGTEVSDEAEATVHLLAQPSLVLQKQASPEVFTGAGDEIVYTLEVENTGNVALNSINVTDPLIGLDYTISTLAPGTVYTLNGTHTILPGDMARGYVTNVAHAVGEDGGGSVVSDDAEATIHLLAQPALALKKSANPEVFTGVGDEIVYTIEVENTGNVPLNSVQVTDPLIGLDHSIPTLAPGETQSLNGTYTTLPGDLSRGYVTNVAHAAGEDAGGTVVSDQATVTVDLLPMPSLALQKTADQEVFTAEGDEIIYTLVIENTGNVPLTNVRITDAPIGLDEVIPTLAVGERVTMEGVYAIVYEDLLRGFLTNRARAQTVFNRQMVFAEDGVTIDLLPEPSIALVKNALPASYNRLGEEIVFTLIVENSGNVPLAPGRVRDPLTGLDHEIAQLMPGQSMEFETTHIVTQQDLDRGSLTNVAYASGWWSDEEYQAVAEITLQANVQPVITISKSSNIDEFSAVGTPIKYTIVVENPGNVGLSDVLVSDPLVAMNETIASFPPGSRRSFTGTYITTQNDLNAGVVTNRARVLAYHGGNELSESDGVLVRARQNPAMELRFSALPEIYSATGEIIRFTVEAENTGNVDLIRLNFSEDLLHGQHDMPDLPIGSSQTVVIDYEVTQNDLNNGFIGAEGVLQARVRTGTQLKETANVMLWARFNDLIANDVESDQEVSGRMGGVAVADVLYNDSLNGRPVSLSDVRLQLVNPASSPNIQLDVNTGAVVVLPQTPGGVYYLDYGICELRNLANCDQARVTLSVIPSADLEVSKSVLSDQVVAGQEVSFEIKLRNHGPSSAYNIVTEEFLPDILAFRRVDVSRGQWNNMVWQLDSLESGEEATMILVAYLDPFVPHGLEIISAAETHSETPDPVLSNNRTEVIATVHTLADLAIEKTASPTPVVAGTQLLYEIKVSNHGPSNAAQVVVTDHLPEGLVLLEQDASSGFWDDHMWHVGDLIPGGEALLKLLVAVPSDLTHGSIIVNRAEVVSETEDPEADNNTSTVNVAVDTMADLYVQMEAGPDPVVAGEMLTLDMEVGNHGPSNARLVELVLTLDEGLEFEWTSHEGVIEEGNQLVWMIDMLEAGAREMVQVHARVSQDLLHESHIGARLEVAAGTRDDQQENNVATTHTLVQAMADLSVAIVSPSENPVAGETMHYTLVFENHGPSEAKEVVLTNLTHEFLASSQYSSDEGTSWLDWEESTNVGPLAVGQGGQIMVRHVVGSHALGELVLSHSISSEVGDTNPDNNVAELPVQIVALADMGVSMLAGEQHAVAGVSYKYSIRLFNEGPSDARKFYVMSVYPEIMEFVRANKGGQKDHNQIEWGFDYLAAGESTMLEVEIYLPSHLRPRSFFDLEASVAIESTDPDPENNQDAIQLTILTLADLSLEKFVSTPVATGGDYLDYTLRVTNTGPSDALGVNIVDQLPEGLSFVSAGLGGYYIEYDHSIIWTLDRLPSNQSVLLTARTRVDREVAGGTRLTNRALVISQTRDPNDHNTMASADVAVEASDSLFIPEGFSPNGDGINDTFVIGGLEDLYPNSSIQIFDHWGNLVYEANPYGNNWDGRAMDGRMLPTGTYYYVLDIGRGREPIRGFVYLVR